MATAVSVTDMITIVPKVDAYDLCSRCSCMIRSEERRCSGTNAITDSWLLLRGASSSRLNVGTATRWRYIGLQDQSINHSYGSSRLSDFISGSPLEVRSQPTLYGLEWLLCTVSKHVQDGVVNYLFSFSYPVCFSDNGITALHFHKLEQITITGSVGLRKTRCCKT